MLNTKVMAKHNLLGEEGERLAASYLQQKGYSILETNWRYSRAEVDIIAMDGDVLVCVEVKSRSTEMWGSPETAVTAKKEKLLGDALSMYMEEIDHQWEVRFDVVAVVIINDRHHEIKHYKDAFFPGMNS